MWKTSTESTHDIDDRNQSFKELLMEHLHVTDCRIPISMYDWVVETAFLNTACLLAG